MSLCVHDDCLNAARPGKQDCETCHKRKVRKGTILVATRHGARYASPRDRIRALALRLADVDSEDDAEYRLADDALWKAVQEVAERLHARRTLPTSRVGVDALVAATLGPHEGGLGPPPETVPLPRESPLHPGRLIPPGQGSRAGGRRHAQAQAPSHRAEAPGRPARGRRKAGG